MISLAKLMNSDCVSQDLFRTPRRSRTPVGMSASLIVAKLSPVFQVMVVVPSENVIVLVGGGCGWDYIPPVSDQSVGAR